MDWITWYSDNKLAILFDSVPCVGIRYILPSFTKEEKENIKKFPFVCSRDLTVRIIRKINNVETQTFEFTIQKGYYFDGASIPRFFWRIIGAPTDNKFLIAALIHDVLCENHHYIMNDRKFSTEIFDALLKVSDVGKFKRFFMTGSVNIFQKWFCKW